MRTEQETIIHGYIDIIDLFVSKQRPVNKEGWNQAIKAAGR